MDRRSSAAKRLRRAAAPVALLAATVALAEGGSGSAGADPEAFHAPGIERYLAQVEPVRLGVNRLLDHADPILDRYRRHRIGAAEAQRRMKALEARFAVYAVEIHRVRPVPVELAAAQRAYARTYVLEDAYLRALTAALPARSFDGLPETEDAQRTAIVAWRTRLQAVAARLGVPLPADVQLAGRGEIAPSPLGGT